jgi:hypothetical protein
MALLCYSTCQFGLSPASLVVVVMLPLCCNRHRHHFGLHSSSCWGALFLLPPRVGLGCTRPPCIGLGHNPPPLPLRVAVLLPCLFVLAWVRFVDVGPHLSYHACCPCGRPSLPSPSPSVSQSIVEGELVVISSEVGWLSLWPCS